MARNSLLQQSVTQAAGMRRLSSRTWKNLCTTLDRGLMQRMANQARGDSEDADRMRQGLANAVLCASAKVQDALASFGVETTPRQLMRAAKHDAEVLVVLRGLLEEGTSDGDRLAHLRRSLASTEVDAPDDAEPAESEVPAGTATFTLIEADRGATLRFISASTGSGFDLAESETLLLYGVLRGVLPFVCVESADGAYKLRVAAREGRVSLAWEKGRRVVERLRFASLPERLSKLAAQSLLKVAPNPDQLVRLDAAALDLAATPQR